MFGTSIWNLYAPVYERVPLQKHSLGPTRRAIIRRLSDWIEDNANYECLEMGCATGQQLREIKEAFPRSRFIMRGVDVSPRMIEEASARGGDIDYQACAAEEYRDEAGRYDIIICAHSIPYYRDKAGVIAGFARMLKAGGRLYIAHGAEDTLYDKFVLTGLGLTLSKARYPSSAQMDAWLAPNFRIIHRERIRERAYMPSIYVVEAGRLPDKRL